MAKIYHAAFYHFSSLYFVGYDGLLLYIVHRFINFLDSKLVKKLEIKLVNNSLPLQRYKRINLALKVLQKQTG